MQNEIIINVDPGETRVALLERSVFTELHVEREEDKSVVGNVVKGRVSRVLPGMQAAFVDIGLEKAAFLYVGDYFDNTGGDKVEEPRRGRGRNGRNGRRVAPPKIETVLSEGQEIVVQIAKAPIGTKGARITSNISIPGRHLVLTPWSRRVGVSRRIDSDKERKRLKEIVDRIRPKDLGFIIRTAGDGVREADLEADIKYLSTIWKKVHRAHAEKPAPAMLHEEPDLSIRLIRDLATHDTARIVIDNAEAATKLREFCDEFVADPKPEIEHYDHRTPLFDALDLEAQIHANLERKVWLKSGGSLIVDQCEALTAIDVNTGRFVGKRDLEETVFKTNLEAVKEVVHQLRFRNIGGLIIIDLIDMESAEHREKVYRALQEALRGDKARTNILKISELGLCEMTRKRTRESLVQTLCEPCRHCEGRGYMLSGESVAYSILREIKNDLQRLSGHRIAITVSPRVAEQLLSVESAPLDALAEQLGREIEIRAKPGLHQEQFEVLALDEGAPVDFSPAWLRDPAEIAAEDEAERERKADGSKKNGANGRKRTRGRGRGARDDTSNDTSNDGEATENDEAAAAEAADDTPDSGGENAGAKRKRRRRPAKRTADDAEGRSDRDADAREGDEGEAASVAAGSRAGDGLPSDAEAPAANDGGAAASTEATPPSRPRQTKSPADVAEPPASDPEPAPEAIDAAETGAAPARPPIPVVAPAAAAAGGPDDAEPARQASLALDESSGRLSADTPSPPSGDDPELERR